MTGTVPREEISRRLAHFQKLLAAGDISLALIRQPADLYYYTGTVADGFLAVPVEGPARFLVRRPKSRLAGEETFWEPVFFRDFGDLAPLLDDLFGHPQTAVGLELDVLPAAFYLRLQQKVFPRVPLQDISPLIRRQRMVKSGYEIEQIRQAAAILDETFAAVPEMLRPGLTELELSAEIEYRLRLRCHQGLIRLRNFNLEMFFGHVLSGPAGLEPAYTDTPSGGLGFSPAFPQGASLKPLAPNEPIIVDIASCVNGYLADMTRLFVLGDLPLAAWRVYDLTLELFHFFETRARPGVPPPEIYEEICSRVAKAGYREVFMGREKEQVSFLGHGVGLELDEFPLISARFPYLLEEDMVLAFEPKFFLPEIGLVGLEDTGRITPQGVEWLTQASREVTRS
ncbi:MAG: M24 family metallopeptidase [Desulfobaccales bacterium]